jgi:hypothetical protein
VSAATSHPSVCAIAQSFLNETFRSPPLNSSHVAAADVRAIREVLLLGGYSEKDIPPVVPVGAHTLTGQPAIRSTLASVTPFQNLIMLRDSIVRWTRQFEIER